jgi:hypothetical protein
MSFLYGACQALNTVPIPVKDKHIAVQFVVGGEFSLTGLIGNIRIQTGDDIL